MIRVESFLGILFAVAVGAFGGFDAPFSNRGYGPSYYQDTVGDSLPNDTVYIPATVMTYPLALSTVNIVHSYANSWEACRTQATQKGGHIFDYGRYDDEGCFVFSLQFPLCTTQKGNFSIYIQPKYLTNGTSNDGTTVEPLKKGVELGYVLSNPEAEYGSFRVDSSTILDYPEFFNSDSATSLQTILLETEDRKIEIDADIVVSPACFSNSSCGTTFIYPIPAIKRTIKVFSDYCGKRITVHQGEEVYLLSHDEFGCSLFPDNGYGGSNCRVNYRGYADPLKITIQYFNFVGSDACDGFALSALAFYDRDNWNVYQLCRDPVTEIIAQNPRGRLDLSGISATQRPKIGFIIKLSYA